MNPADMARRLTPPSPASPTQHGGQPTADVRGGAHEDVVGSSTIAALGYDHTTHTMHVRFHSGATYAHSGVTLAAYAALRAAPSPGKHYARHHRGVNHRRVG